VNDLSIPVGDERQAPPGASLGQRLRSLRQERGLAVSDVSQATKFSVRQIEALESGDLAALPPVHAFIRGFVRSYAKLLKVDAEPLLTLLDESAPPPESDVLHSENVGTRMPTPHPPRNWLSLLAVIAIVAAIAALGVHYFYRGATRAPVSPAQDVTTAPLAVVPPTPVPLGTETAGVGSTPAAISGALPAAPGDKLAVASTLVAPALAPADPSGNQLILSFDDKAWVEIRDATERIIFAQMNLPGSRQVVSGKPPYELVIGNAARVRLQYGERPVDLAPYIRAEVARLKVE